MAALGGGDAGWAWGFGWGGTALAWWDLQCCRRGEAEGGAERAQQAGGARDCGEERCEFGVVEDGVQLAVADGGALDLFDQPVVGARQARAGMAEELGGGLFGAWGARPGGGGGTQRAVAPTLVQGGEAGEGAGEVEIDEVEQAAGDGGGAGVGRDGGAQAIGHPGEEAQGGGWLREGVKEHLLGYKLVYVRLQGDNLDNRWHARKGFGQ